MDREHQLLFNDSFQTCYADPTFIERFYQHFIARSNEVKAKFSQTDMRVQIRMMKKSLAYMMMVKRNPDSIRDTAVRHDKHHLNISPQLYTDWLEAMLCAVSECDPLYTERTAQAWRESLRPGIELMIKTYHQS